MYFVCISRSIKEVVHPNILSIYHVISNLYVLLSSARHKKDQSVESPGFFFETFFKIYFVFHRRNKCKQVWNDMKVNQ